MSNVLIFIDGENVPATSLMQPHKATRLGLGELRSAILSGKPIVEREIFDSNYDKHAALIRNVLAAVEDGEMSIDEMKRLAATTWWQDAPHK